MVFKLQLRSRIWLSALILLACWGWVSPAQADSGTPSAAQALAQAQVYFRDGYFFKSARYAFAASELDSRIKSDAYSWIALSLAEAHLYNAASYFFIRTLQTDNKVAIRRVLPETTELLNYLGPDLLRRYLILHTKYEDYDVEGRNAYLYSLAKDAMLSGDASRALGYLTAIQVGSRFWPYVLEMRGSAHAILGKNDEALADFRQCEEKAQDLPVKLEQKQQGSAFHKKLLREAQDLQARCFAGEARTLYQMDRFEDADRTYDQVPKTSLVWPGILFEQGWNSFAKSEYNRTLGKLVSYKSPALSFVLNTEVDVLRAQSFLALCLYDDANQVINEFNSKYSAVGEKVKKFVESNQRNLPVFYELGKKTLKGSLYDSEPVHHMANQFVRGPYFQNLVSAEEQVSREREAIARFASESHETEKSRGGFPGFLNQVLNWRVNSIQLLGGMFVKNSFLDYHSALISDFEKMAFIKLEMLNRAKEQLLNRHSVVSIGSRSRGNVVPTRRDDQMYWNFNGEFWNDELGDYVFGLESECKPNGV